MRTFFSKFLLLAVFPCLLSSCEKKYLEIVPVVEVVEDLSIPTGTDIKLFTFTSPQVCYAAGDTNLLFKTTDGGHSWKKLPLTPAYSTPHSKCKRLEFFDDQNGFCIIDDNTILKTTDGGNTWTEGSRGIFAGIGNNGKVYIIEKAIWPSNGFLIKESSDKGNTYKTVFSYTDNRRILMAKVIGSGVYIVNHEGFITGYNPVTKDTLENFINLGNSTVRDFVLTSELNLAVLDDGSIRSNEYSVYNSMQAVSGRGSACYSVDVFEGLGIAAGKKNLISNMDIQREETWNDLLDTNGNSLTENFYKIKFIDRNRFYVSGENGLFRIMKI